MTVDAIMGESIKPARSGQIDWRSAACRGAPRDLFITPSDSLEDDPPYPSKEAQQFCNLCPIVAECLQWALDHDEVGVWGGTSTYQRRQLKRERTRDKCPGCASRDLIMERFTELCLSCGMSWWCG